MWIGNLGDLQEEWHPLVSANVVEDAGATGIVVYGRSITVSGNTVIRTSGAGIKVNTRSVAGDDRATQSRIDSNVLQQNLFHGLQIERGEGGLLIEGNRLETNQDSGLYVFGGSFSGRIAGNSFFSNREVGVYLYEASGVTIEANQFGSMAAAPQKVGIVLEALRGRSVKDVTIVRNEIWDQQLDGVALRARSGQLDAIGIDANAIGGRSRSGVRLEADDGAPVGSIVVGSNCFDLQLTRTVVDTRTGGLAVPFASDCAALRPGAVP
jgi:parallel beta-helix repeat protein